MKEIIKINSTDNVVVTLVDRVAGEEINVDGQTITLAEAVGRGHKIALSLSRQGKILSNMVYQ